MNFYNQDFWTTVSNPVSVNALTVDTIVDKPTENPIYKDNSVELRLVNINENQSVNTNHFFDQYVNWGKNRPPDMVRVQQIKEFILNNNIQLVPGVIYAWRRTENIPNKYYVYDGIHRLMAVKELIQNGDILKEQPLFVLIQIKTATREQEIIDDFINLNKSVSVPSIYLEDTDILKKTVCQNIAEELCKRYPTFVSPSRKPFIYNFNRDVLIEFVSTWNINFSKPGIQHLAIQELLKLNQSAKEYVYKMGITHPKKCKYHDFFLFFMEASEIKRRMEEILR